MINLRALIQLARLHQHLGPQAQAMLQALGTKGLGPSLAAATAEERENLEKLERWLQTAALEGVEQAGSLAEELRKALYPTGKKSHIC